MTKTELPGRIEHTLLKPEATADQIDVLCDEACEFGFLAVCVNPVFVARAVRRLDAVEIARRPFVVSVAGFPLGASHPETKADEARRSVADGAREIDMVVHVGSLIAGDRTEIRREIELLAHAVHGAMDRRLKVILESAALTTAQMILGCRCAMEGEADFVKTSTGMHVSGGATVEAVRLLHKHASPMQVKAAGGIRTAQQALAMIEAGAARIGTSSGVAIVREFDSHRTN